MFTASYTSRNKKLLVDSETVNARSHMSV